MAQIRFRAFALLLFCVFSSAAQGADEKRVIIGLYAAKAETQVSNLRLFHAAEMPLNHLGLKLEPYNAALSVPAIAGRNDVRGVLIWLQQNDLPDPDKVIALIAAAVKNKIPVIMMEQVPGAMTKDGAQAGDERAARALSLLGVRAGSGYRPYTFDMKVAFKDAMVGFERPFTGVLPPVDTITSIGPGQPLLTLQRGDGTRTNPILMTPQGVYIAPDYALWGEPNGDRALWRIDPFALFGRVYGTDGLPRPDPTTLSGRRIYYSHIDGDGWLNVTRIESYTKRRALSSEVILREAIVPFPDLPVTVAPIAADLDPKFGGTPEAQEIARTIFRLPQVETGSHTYTHPYQWSYFAPRNYDPKDELKYKDLYAHAVIEPGYDGAAGAGKASALEEGYTSPRAFGDIPFNLNKEIKGAADFISSFAPPAKPVRIVQWSGDTAPFKEAIEATRALGLENINGGDTRKDNTRPSHFNVAPLGRVVDGAQQIYSSGANENIYTNNWTRNFGAFRQTMITAVNTGTPRRLAAVNIYYHMYSGEREASLSGLIAALKAVSLMELAPVTTSRYAQIAQGFYKTQIEPVGPKSWRIKNRGSLATMRFDDATNLTVDYSKSEGLLGDRRENNTLYVAMDSANTAPLIVLKEGSPAASARLVLNDARWEISQLNQTAGSAAFNARGFGPGAMRWRTDPGAHWRIEVSYKDKPYSGEARANAEGVLSFAPPHGAEEGVSVRLTRLDPKGA